MYPSSGTGTSSTPIVPVLPYNAVHIVMTFLIVYIFALRYRSVHALLHYIAYTLPHQRTMRSTRRQISQKFFVSRSTEHV